MSQTLHVISTRRVAPLVIVALLLALATPAAGQQPEPANEEPRETVVVDRDGFRWGDAAIGAAAGAGLVFVLVGVLVVMHARRPPRPPVSRASSGR